MLKRKTFMYFKMVIAFLGMFIAAIAIAQAQDPGAADSCTAGGYTIEAVRGTNGEFPVKGTCYEDSSGNGPYTCYKYEYLYTSGNIGAIDHLFFAITFDPYDPITVFEFVYWGDDKDYYHVDYYDPCDGSGNEDFADFVCNVRTIRISPQGNKATFFADTSRNGSGSHLISTGKKNYGCNTPIIAAGYYPERPLGTLPSTECISVNERLSMKIVRGPDGCDVDADLVKFWLDNPTCEEGTGLALTTAVAPLDPEIDPFICTSTNAQGCPECITGDGGTSPTWYTYTTAGGYKVKICYDLDNPPSYSCP